MDTVEKILAMGIPKAEVWIAEAKFGYVHVVEYCRAIAKDANVLEVGCGSGILLSMLAEEFENLRFTGLEPIATGFSALRPLNEYVADSGVNIENVRYESYASDERFDFIYCVNVFEHLDDWENFLRWASGLISERGKLLILCPNYSFPYEPHFRIPTVCNKALTYRVFENEFVNSNRQIAQTGFGNHSTLCENEV